VSLIRSLSEQPQIGFSCHIVIGCWDLAHSCYICPSSPGSVDPQHGWLWQNHPCIDYCGNANAFPQVWLPRSQGKFICLCMPNICHVAGICWLEVCPYHDWAVSRISQFLRWPELSPDIRGADAQDEKTFDRELDHDDDVTAAFTNLSFISPVGKNHFIALSLLKLLNSISIALFRSEVHCTWSTTQAKKFVRIPFSKLFQIAWTRH